MTLDLSLYLVTDSAQAARQGRGIVETVALAVAGGVTAVQVREKSAEAREFLCLVEALAERLPAHVSLFINDRIDVFQAARLHGARVTGVHVGQQDLAAEDVRELLGPEPVIGLTANTAAELAAAEASTARIGYVGIGTVRVTASKPDAPHGAGVAGIGELARTCSLPAVAIGGIVPADLPALRSAGLAGVAVISWICASADPRGAAMELSRAWNAPG